MSNFTKYLGSYERRSPRYYERLRKEARGREYNLEYYKRDKQRLSELTQVTTENCPELYEALTEECAFRKVEIPNCYLDRSVRLGASEADIYSIFVEPDFLKRLNKQEMRALVAHEVKHLYQKYPPFYVKQDKREEVKKRYHENEFDCDRSAIESAGYEAVESYIHKAAAYTIEKMIVPEVLHSRLMHLTKKIAKKCHLTDDFGIYEQPHQAIAVVATICAGELPKFDKVGNPINMLPSYNMIEPYIHKATRMVIEKIVPVSFMREKLLQFHEKFPKFLSENFNIEIDDFHPSSAARVKSMKGHAAEIEAGRAVHALPISAGIER